MDYAQNHYELRNLLYDIGYIKEDLITRLEDQTGMSSASIAKHLENRLKTISNAIEYKDKYGNDTTEEDAYYVWVSTGLEDISNVYGNTIYIAFAKNTERLDMKDIQKYFCYRVATLYSLERNLEKWSNGEVSPTKQAKTELYSQIYNMLLVKDGWDVLPEYKQIGELLKLMEAKIENEIEAGTKDPGCLFNNDNTRIAYNTGLINLYGKDIVIIADLDSAGEIASRKIMLSKTQMKQDGFSQTEIAPVKFYENRKDLIFSADIDDFDLDDIARIQHVVEHRRDRFPDCAKEMSDDELVGKIQSSLEFDLKMTARNPYWAAPFYNIKNNTIQYLLPLFLHSFSDKPDLAMIVGKGEHFYEVRTVLALSSAYANAACLVSPPSAWL